MKPNYVKILLSVFIVYHLLVIAIVPNEHSYLTHKLRPVLYPYSNLFGLTRVWQFFSPDPGPSVFLEYTAMKDGSLIATGFFPPLQSPFFFRDHYNRRIAGLRIAAKIENYTNEVVIPYLCRQNPGASLINYSIWVGGPPSIEDIERGGVINDVARREVTKTDVVFCPGEGTGEMK